MTKLELIKSKICHIEDLKNDLALWKFKGQKVVFTNGCFDIVHLGHVDYLAKAASFGNKLIIGLNTDSSVSRIKGSQRPLQDEHSRSMILAAFSFVDKVVFFDEETPYNLIKYIQPDVLVKGSDYKEEDIVGYDIIKAKGGEVITIDFVEGYSTSKIVSKILNSDK